MIQVLGHGPFFVYMWTSDNVLMSSPLNCVYLPFQSCIIILLLFLLHFCHSHSQVALSWWNVVTSNMVLLQLWLCPFWADFNNVNISLSHVLEC